MDNDWIRMRPYKEIKNGSAGMFSCVIVIVFVIVMMYLVWKLLCYSTRHVKIESVNWQSGRVPHRFITHDSGELITHYGSDEHRFVLSTSDLKIWYFDRFHQVDSRLTMLFLMERSTLDDYYWVVEFCRQIGVNLVMIYVKSELISTLIDALDSIIDAPNYNLILATDDRVVKLRSFMEQYSIDSSHYRLTKYKAIIMLSQDLVGRFPESELTIVILAHNINETYGEEFTQHGSAIVYTTDWILWRSKRSISLDGDSEAGTINFILQRIAELLMGN